MKILSILLLSALSLFAKAQTGCNFDPADSSKYVSAGVWQWSISELKEAAKTSYFYMLDKLNATDFNKDSFYVALNKYEFWRKAVDLKLSSKKDRDAFHDWVAAEAKSAGKLNN